MSSKWRSQKVYRNSFLECHILHIPLPLYSPFGSQQNEQQIFLFVLYITGYVEFVSEE